jgi:hypothetical protein
MEELKQHLSNLEKAYKEAKLGEDTTYQNALWDEIEELKTDINLLYLWRKKYGNN